MNSFVTEGDWQWMGGRIEFRLVNLNVIGGGGKGPSPPPWHGTFLLNGFK